MKYMYMIRVLLVIGIIVFTGCVDQKKEQEAYVKANVGVSQSSLLQVHKQPTCSCCGEWVEHIQERGFKTDIRNSEDLSHFKQSKGISPQYQSCHTAVSKEGFVFEGHIPASIIHKFLANPSEGAIGLAVPGMPLGSPGMEVEDRFMPYDVLLLKQDGTSEVYAYVSNKKDQY